MTRKDLIAKIRKCLALAKSANEHEAAAALAMAAKLAAEHEIDLTLIEIEEHVSRASRTLRPPKWQTILSAAVARALGCHKYINADGDIAFVGRLAAPEIAAYAFAVLRRQLLAVRSDYIAKHLRRCRPGRKRARADIYCEGWTSAVFRKIAAIAPEVPEDDAISSWLAVNVPDLVTIAARSASAGGAAADRDYWRGFDRGSDAQLNRGMGAAEAPRQLPG